MEMRDRAGLYKVVSDVMGYYKQDASEFTLKVWWEACKGYDLEQVSKALTAHAIDPDRGQFAPKVADIVRQISGTKTDRAALAWGKVFEAMQRVGQYQDVVFDDPAIHAVIMDIGGWPRICQTNESEISYLQHRFCEAHRAYTGRGEFDYPRVLIGLRSADHEYKNRGLPLPEPVLIGSSEKARHVYLAGKKGGKVEVTLVSQLQTLSIAN
jgi:hypothetical protein